MSQTKAWYIEVAIYKRDPFRWMHIRELLVLENLVGRPLQLIRKIAVLGVP